MYDPQLLNVQHSRQRRVRGIQPSVYRPAFQKCSELPVAPVTERGVVNFYILDATNYVWTTDVQSKIGVARKSDLEFSKFVSQLEARVGLKYSEQLKQCATCMAFSKYDS